jgi:6-phosphogluconolactonase/glucosamine-6-phosphate isomerase/deaminase
VTVAVRATPEELACATAACLPGGSTPRRVYELLATAEHARFPWERVHWFFGDAVHPFRDGRSKSGHDK